MSEYLILAETIIYKNNRLTCINTYDNFRTVAMPAEFNFDIAILCGPKWSIGEHNLRVKAVASNGKEIDLGTAKVNIPHEDFVYNAFLNNIRLAMDYSVSDLTFYVYDGDKEVYSRKYPVISMLVPQGVNKGENEEDNNQVVSDLTEADLENCEPANQEEKQENQEPVGV